MCALVTVHDGLLRLSAANKKKKDTEELDPRKYRENRLAEVAAHPNAYPHKFHVRGVAVEVRG